MLPYYSILIAWKWKWRLYLYNWKKSAWTGPTKLTGGEWQQLSSVYLWPALVARQISPSPNSVDLKASKRLFSPKRAPIPACYCLSCSCQSPFFSFLQCVLWSSHLNQTDLEKGTSSHLANQKGASCHEKIPNLDPGSHARVLSLSRSGLFCTIFDFIWKQFPLL